MLVQSDLSTLNTLKKHSKTSISEVSVLQTEVLFENCVTMLDTKAIGKGDQLYTKNSLQFSQVFINSTHCASIVECQTRNASLMAIFQNGNCLTILCVPNTDIWIFSNLPCCNQLFLWMQSKASTNIRNYFTITDRSIISNPCINRQEDIYTYR